MNIGAYTIFGCGNESEKYIIYKHDYEGQFIKVGEAMKGKPTKLKLPKYLTKHLKLGGEVV